MLAMLLPTTLPTAMPGEPSREAIRLTTSSGADVPADQQQHENNNSSSGAAPAATGGSPKKKIVSEAELVKSLTAEKEKETAKSVQEILSIAGLIGGVGTSLAPVGENKTTETSTTAPTMTLVSRLGQQDEQQQEQEADNTANKASGQQATADTSSGPQAIPNPFKKTHHSSPAKRKAGEYDMEELKKLKASPSPMKKALLSRQSSFTETARASQRLSQNSF